MRGYGHGSTPRVAVQRVGWPNADEMWRAASVAGRNLRKSDFLPVKPRPWANKLGFSSSQASKYESPLGTIYLLYIYSYNRIWRPGVIS